MMQMYHFLMGGMKINLGEDELKRHMVHVLIVTMVVPSFVSFPAEVVFVGLKSAIINTAGRERRV